MALKVHQVGGSIAVAAMEKMVETDFVQRGAGGVGRDVAAETGMLAIGVDDHRHGVPAGQTLDPPLQFAIARVRGSSSGGMVFTYGVLIVDGIWMPASRKRFDSLLKMRGACLFPEFSGNIPG